MPIATYTRYLLVDNDTFELAVRTHQDDMEDPIVGSSLIHLLEQAAEWADMGLTDFLKSDDFARHTIIREEIVRGRLNEAEKKELAVLIKRQDDEPDEESKAVSGLAEYISPEDCITSKQHLTVCDKDGFCNYCGHQAEEIEDQS